LRVHFIDTYKKRLFDQDIEVSQEADTEGESHPDGSQEVEQIIFKVFHDV